MDGIWPTDPHVMRVRGSKPVANGNFDHPVNGQKGFERAAGSAPWTSSFHPHPSFEGAALKSHLPRKGEGKKEKSIFGTIAKR